MDKILGKWGLGKGVWRRERGRGGGRGRERERKVS